MLYSEYDDLHVLSAAATGGGGFPLCSVVRNEMYFLPSFLRHYRRLGVEHFVVLDDRSEDGTRDYLAGQPDVTLLGSGRGFAEVVTPDHGPLAGKPMRMQILWKSFLAQRYALDRWSALADADEFVCLPEGMSLADAAGRAEEHKSGSVAAVMLDVYPKRLADLQHTQTFDPDGDWFFDGERHLELGDSGALRVLYPGVRSRLLAELGIVRPSLRQRLSWMIRGRRYKGFNTLVKPFLRKWTEADSMLNAHTTTHAPTPSMLLPLKHYKFNYDTFRRVQDAIRGRQYFQGSKEYVALNQILLEMQRRKRPFLCRRSRPAADFDALRATGNALLA